MIKMKQNKIKKLYKQIEIDEDNFNVLEYLNYTIYTHEHVLETILNKGRYNYNIDIYDYFMNNYNNAKIELRLTMQELINEEEPNFLKLNNYLYELNMTEHTIDLFTLEDREVK